MKMRTLPKLALALALSASTLTAAQPAEAHWHRYWARPYYYTYAPTYYYAAPPAYYAPPAYDASGAIVAGMALGLMGAAIAAAASQPSYVYPAWPGCYGYWQCW